MATEIENRIVAWVTVTGPDILTRATQWKGQGIQSVTRSALGDFLVLLEDGVDLDLACVFLTPSGGQQQPGTPDPIQSCIQRVAPQSIRCLFSAGDNSTTRVDPQGFSLEVITGNAEAVDQAVA